MSPPNRVALFTPADAELVCTLFREVYGDAYPIQSVYDPQALIRASQEGQYFPFVIRGDGRRVVAYGALNRSAPYGGVYEFVQGIVAPDCQGAGLGRRLFEWVEHYLPTLPGAETYFGESICNHLHTQKAGALIRSIETGLELDLMPGAAYRPGDAAPGRVAALDMFRTFVPRPHQVFVPEVYDSIIRLIYEGFDDRRTLTPATPAAHPDQETALVSQWFPFAGVLRLAASRTGPDFPDRLDQAAAAAQGPDLRVIQVWLNLSCPWIAADLATLRQRGYCFGGVFPRWFDQDGLLMQKTLGAPNWEGIKLWSPRAEAIREAVFADWTAVSRPLAPGGTASDYPHA